MNKKIKGSEGTYEAWHEAQLAGIEAGRKPSRELLKAEPDLAEAIEREVPAKLQAAFDVLNDGGLQALTPIQQRIFQLSVVEGGSLREVGKALGIDYKTVQEHLKALGKKLRILCELKLEEM